MKTVSDVYKEDVTVVNANTNFEDILVLMKDKGMGKIPVEENGEIIGVITRDDLLTKKEEAPEPIVLGVWDLLITLPASKRFKERYNKLISTNAKELMTKEFTKIDINDNLEEVLTDMIEQNIRFYLVYDKENFKGLLTRTDLVNKIF